ncbi:malto-oligosyltrehalose synthase [Rhizobium paranaense]|uniref:(1->4)-alpha-D-glucan 1-alpha-D-glucosylmutase n=1 Tax=Rhizobium paranaense TaxID=1650438 RepID=A0A7W9D315_9HYPH|nr:malto-oligosyltrehalose synthase [Rhizobium paranaense]MBB5575853.1 (1->4)-alpha-D-glucan 1-alpha-D-glucosylmutase [Rhizobium paranaense]
MNVPTSTYRLQLRGGVTFDRASELVPYLKDLGISHLYLSPIFTATGGSTHGYDITDPNEIDPAIGGRKGFDILTASLQKAGLGLIVDIVPNHMAASLENPWWRDVLRYGPKSAYARHFDIDWSEKLTLPRLGKRFEEALAAGELQLRSDATDDLLQLAYFDNCFPLSEDSAQFVMAQTGTDTERLLAFSSDAAKMKELIDKQHWQLLCWRDAARHLNYRRFFEVAGLVGIRVEDEQVFQDTHRMTIDLVRSGQVQGLRIDHIDGLADPKTYLERLRRSVGADTFIVVEKILGRGDTLPADWPVSGTTGYEFISAMTDLFIAGDGLEKIEAAYEIVDKEHGDFAGGLRNAKLLMIERNFAGETARLTKLACLIFPGCDEVEMSSALRELLVAFPVYRTYCYRGALSAEDEAVIRGAVDKAQARLLAAGALNAVKSLLCGEIAGDRAVEFRARFQQLSGPVMAKAVEDTLFYRYNRLIAMNEVGGEPAMPPRGIAAFHQMMADRLQRQPYGLSTTSTHDTKRGEDARARLYGLSQYPNAWIDGVARWRALNAAFRTDLADGPAPEPNIEWMLYQALAGIWPADLEQNSMDELKGRFAAYALKAIREAKLRTDWMDEKPAYEKAVLDYASALLSPQNQAFLNDFGRTLQPFIKLGYLNSLSQVLIKLTAPGIPDIYQGAEGLDFSMVDPDNRRPVDRRPADASRSQSPFEEPWARSLKRQIIRSVLRHRKDHPELFLEGSYLPLGVRGQWADKLVAFARVHRKEAAITIVQRSVDAGSTGSDFWGETIVSMPPPLSEQMRDLLTGKPLAAGDISAAQLFRDYPVSFLVTPD